MNLTGHLLISSPGMIDKRFNNSVIYVTNHTESGAWGVCLNKPTEVSIKEVMQRIGIDMNLSGMVHAGGPVNQSSLHFLHTGEYISSESVGHANGIYINGDMEFVGKVLNGQFPRKHRMFLGTCSWAPGQLEYELYETKTSNWITVPATEKMIFDYDTQEQWQECVNYCAQQMVKDWMS